MPKYHDNITEWLDTCPTEIEVIEEFGDSIWVKIYQPWSED